MMEIKINNRVVLACFFLLQVVDFHDNFTYSRVFF